MIPIPAIDLLDGKVVRLEKGDYATPTIYDDDPLNTARKFADSGLEELHVVDLNGARDGRFTNLNQIEKIAEKTHLTIQSGGGVRSIKDAQTLISAGVSRVVCSSMAAKKPEEFKELIGINKGEHAVLGLDLKDGKFAYGGWLQTTDESYEEVINDFRDSGLKYILSTDISRDGMLEGVNVDLYKQLTSLYEDIHIIASGGVADKQDLIKLSGMPVYGVIIGKAYYENRISLEDIVSFLPDKSQ